MLRMTSPSKTGLLKSNLSIVAAIIGNILIAAIKLVAGKLSGSSSMVAEGIHSLVDTGNGILLLHGVRASRRAPSRLHPFGHGQEIFFWTLIVAVLVFGLGGGLSVYQGLHHLGPHEIGHFGLNMTVLGVSLLLELASFTVALREFREDNPSGGLWRAISGSKDPSRFAVLFEDSAAIAGVFAAAISLILARALQAPWLDGAGSLVIGAILAATAVALIGQARRLLIGEGLSASLRDALLERLAGDPDISKVDEFSSMYLGPHSVLLVARLTLRRPHGLEEAAEVRKRLKNALVVDVPEITHAFLELEPPG